MAAVMEGITAGCWVYIWHYLQAAWDQRQPFTLNRSHVGTFMYGAPGVTVMKFCMMCEIVFLHGIGQWCKLMWHPICLLSMDQAMIRSNEWLVAGWLQCFEFAWLFWHCRLGNRKGNCFTYPQRFLSGSPSWPGLFTLQRKASSARKPKQWYWHLWPLTSGFMNAKQLLCTVYLPSSVLIFLIVQAIFLLSADTLSQMQLITLPTHRLPPAWIISTEVACIVWYLWMKQTAAPSLRSSKRSAVAADSNDEDDTDWGKAGSAKRRRSAPTKPPQQRERVSTCYVTTTYFNSLTSFPHDDSDTDLGKAGNTKLCPVPQSHSSESVTVKLLLPTLTHSHASCPPIDGIRVMMYV